MPQGLDERLRALLPVRLQKSAGGLDAPVYKPFQLELSPDGSVHEVMRLYDDPGRNQNGLGRDAAYYWCAAVERPRRRPRCLPGTRASPGAITASCRFWPITTRGGAAFLRRAPIDLAVAAKRR